MAGQKETMNSKQIDQRKSQTMRVRFTVDKYNMIRTVADTRKLTTSELVRRIIFGWMDSPKTDTVIKDRIHDEPAREEQNGN